MRVAILHKKYISFILAFFIILTGICLQGMQMDSSFALRNNQDVLTLDELPAAYQGAVYALEEPNSQDVIYKGNSRTDNQKGLRAVRTHHENVLLISGRHASLHHLQALDIRLCRTDNLSSVFNVIYIHHQDGVKPGGECC